MSADDIKKAIYVVLTIAVGILCTYGGYMIRDSMEAPEVITPAPEKRQKDDSLILERKPASEPAQTHAIPKGAVVERQVSVTVKPRANKKSDTNKTNVSAEKQPADCPPVRVDLSLIRDTEGGRRVIASSPDGRVIGGLDVPIQSVLLPKSRKWAAGVSYDPFTRSPGAWIERDLGRIRIGADLYQDRRGFDTGMAVRVRVGWTF